MYFPDVVSGRILEYVVHEVFITVATSTQEFKRITFLLWFVVSSYSISRHDETYHERGVGYIHINLGVFHWDEPLSQKRLHWPIPFYSCLTYPTPDLGYTDHKNSLFLSRIFLCLCLPSTGTLQPPSLTSIRQHSFITVRNGRYGLWFSFLTLSRKASGKSLSDRDTYGTRTRRLKVLLLSYLNTTKFYRPKVLKHYGLPYLSSKMKTFWTRKNLSYRIDVLDHDPLSTGPSNSHRIC